MSDEHSCSCGHHEHSNDSHGHSHGHSHGSGSGRGHGPDPMQPVSLSGVKNIIAVGAGKGGVGKSTLSVMLAMGLIRRGFKVGLLDADVYGPSIPKMLGLEEAHPTMTESNVIEPIVAHGLKVMSVGFLVEPGRPLIWRGPMIHGTVKQFLEQVAWAPLDYLIVDLPPGTGDVPLTLSQSIPMTGAVVVCTPQEVALLDAVRAARMYQQLNVEILGVVENMSYFIAPDTGKEYDLFGKGGAAKAAVKLDVPFLGSIPINVSIRLSGDQGTPATLFDDASRSAAGQSAAGAEVESAIMTVVDRLIGQVTRRASSHSGPTLRILGQ
ncbi:MAG: Mrp/NBP35 family ATP-binding protein [Phycisphaerae bacterium]|nr:Mrp/NBP35 family ATP-binding protein [Phycisphaerae bacterium]